MEVPKGIHTINSVKQLNPDHWKVDLSCEGGEEGTTILDRMDLGGKEPKVGDRVHVTYFMTRDVTLLNPS